MLEGAEVAWLENMANGVADGSVNLVDHTPPPQSPEGQDGQGEPIQAPFVTAVTEADLENLQNQAADHAKVEHVDLENEDDGGLVTGNRQKRAVESDAPLSKKKRKHNVAEDSAKLSRKHKSRSSSHRSSSSRKHRSLHIEPEFVKRNFDEYTADPVTASFNVIWNLADFVKNERESAQARIKAAEDERDTEKTLKLVAQKSLNEAREKLKEARSSLTTARGDLKTMEKFRDDLVKERDDGNTKIGELNEEVEKLRAKEKELSSTVQTLNDRVVELESSLKSAHEGSSSSSDPAARIAELEKLLKKQEAETAKMRENAQKAAQYAVKMRELGFNKAMEQIKVVNPGMGAFENSGFLGVGHDVEGDKIVKVDKVSKEKVILYPNP